jgi:hypothetical protein
MQVILLRNKLHLKFDPVSRHNGLFEFEPGDHFQRTGNFSPAVELVQEKEGTLDHAFQSHDAGHDGLSGEMAGEEEFIGADPFDSSDPFAALRLQDPVNEDRRERIGQTVENLFQFFPIRGSIFGFGMNGKPPGPYSFAFFSVEGGGGVSSSVEAEVLISSIPR